MVSIIYNIYSAFFNSVSQKYTFFFHLRSVTFGTKQKIFSSHLNMQKVTEENVN